MPGPAPSEGDRLGSWLLDRALGRGGNGWVFEARHEDRETVAALKVNFSTKPDSADRFLREVTVQRELANQGLALPVLDESHEGSEPAWFVMPLGEQLTTGVHWAVDLRTTVRTVLQLAEVLEQVHEGGRSHRDVKPENIIMWHGQWYLSDFGLVTDPDDDARLTDHSFPMGARYYQADELIRRFNEPNYDYRPADVFGLVKVLWTMGSGQNYPPPGWQPADDEGARLSTYSSHAEARLLDYVIDVGTRREPLERPTAADLVRELRWWLEPPSSNEVTRLSLDDVAAPIRNRVAAEERNARRKADQQAIVSQLEREHFAPALGRIKTALHGQVPLLKEDTGSPWSVHLYRRHGFEDFHGGCSSSYLFYRVGAGKVLIYGHEIGWQESGRAFVSVGSLLLDDEGFANPQIVWEWHEPVHLGTPSAQAQIELMASGLIANVGLGVERLARSLE